MDGPYTLHYHSKQSEAVEHVDLPSGRILVLGRPCVGESLVLVGEDGVVQTSMVQQCRTTPSGLVIDTANSCYTLSYIGESTAA